MTIPHPQHMSASLKAAIFATFASLWASGCYWLILHYCFARPTEFGLVQHPWAPMILRIHGWIAVVSVFLLGWITARHVSDRWPQMIKRASGLAVASVAGVLAVTGYALYYTTDQLHDAAGVAHEIVGGAAILVALMHWRRYRPRRRLSRRGATREHRMASKW